MHTDARPSMPSHRYTHACKSIHTRMHDEMAADRRRCGRRCACVCASGHPYTPRCTSVDTVAHVQMGIPHPRARTRTRTRSRRHGFYICTHTYTYVLTHTHICVHVLSSRASAPLPTRAPTHIRTRTYAQTCTLYMLANIDI